nr:MAG TPA: hypothetical protein [Ackermannviridae sp.]
MDTNLKPRIRNLRNKLSNYKYVHFIYYDKFWNEKVITYKFKDLDIILCTTFFRIYIHSLVFHNNVEPITNITNVKFSNRPNENINSFSKSHRNMIDIQYLNYDGKNDKSKNISVEYSKDYRVQKFRFDLEVWYSFNTTKDMLKALKNKSLRKAILNYTDENKIPDVINYDEIKQNSNEWNYLTNVFSLIKPLKLKKKNRKYRMLG